MFNSVCGRISSTLIIIIIIQLVCVCTDREILYYYDQLKFRAKLFMIIIVQIEIYNSIS